MGLISKNDRICLSKNSIERISVLLRAFREFYDDEIKKIISEFGNLPTSGDETIRLSFLKLDVSLSVFWQNPGLGLFHYFYLFIRRAGALGPPSEGVRIKLYFVELPDQVDLFQVKKTGELPPVPVKKQKPDDDRARIISAAARALASVLGDDERGKEGGKEDSDGGGEGSPPPSFLGPKP